MNSWSIHSHLVMKDVTRWCSQLFSQTGSENCRTNWAFWIIFSILFCTDSWSSVFYWLLLFLNFKILSLCVCLPFFLHSTPKHIALPGPSPAYLPSHTAAAWLQQEAWGSDCDGVPPPSGSLPRQQGNRGTTSTSACSLVGSMGWPPGPSAGTW